MQRELARVREVAIFTQFGADLEAGAGGQAFFETELFYTGVRPTVYKLTVSCMSLAAVFGACPCRAMSTDVGRARRAGVSAHHVGSRCAMSGPAVPASAPTKPVPASAPTVPASAPTCRPSSGSPATGTSTWRAPWTSQSLRAPCVVSSLSTVS